MTLRAGLANVSAIDVVQCATDQPAKGAAACLARVLRTQRWKDFGHGPISFIRIQGKRQRTTPFVGMRAALTLCTLVAVNKAAHVHTVRATRIACSAALRAPRALATNSHATPRAHALCKKLVARLENTARAFTL